MARKLRVTLVRSLNSRTERQAAVAHSLGLRRLRDSRTHDDTPTIRGQIDKIQHLLEVEEVAEA